MNSDDTKKQMKEIIDRSLESVDILATYHHFLVFGEIKIIWKKEKDPTESKKK
jgi:hypothetical protein